MTETYQALLLNIGLVAALVAAFSYSSALLGPRRTLGGEKGIAYETGLRPLASSSENMTVAYYRFAVLFAIFDVDLAFLAPWVLLRDRLTFGAMAAMSLFLAMVGLTLAYVWKKGALSLAHGSPDE